MKFLRLRPKKRGESNSGEFIVWRPSGIYEDAEKTSIEEPLEEPFLYNLPVQPKALPGNGKIVAVQGVAAGDGATTVAVNLAGILARYAPDMVSLVDLDSYGSVRSRLGLPAGEFLINILDWEDIHSTKDIAKGLINHSTRVLVLPGVIHYDQVDAVKPSLVFKILTLLKEKYSYVVIDCPPVAINNNTWAAVLVADTVLTILSPERDSLDRLHENNGFLIRLGCQNRIFTLLNQAGKPGGIRPADLEGNNFYKLSEVLPYSVNVAECNNRRQVIAHYNQKDDFVKSLQVIVEQILV